MLFVILKHNIILLPTSPVNSTWRPSFAALIASNLPSSSALILFADHCDGAPYKPEAIKILESPTKNTDNHTHTHIYIILYIHVCVCVCMCVCTYVCMYVCTNITIQLNSAKRFQNIWG